MSVNILLLNWNGNTYTPNCVSSILKQDYPQTQIHTFIGDQGSTDGSFEVLKSAPPEWFELIEFRQNIGFSVGYNKMIEQIKARHGDPDYWFFLNNDTKLFPDSVSKMVKVLQKKYEYGIAGLTAYNYNTGKRLEGWGGWIRRDDSKQQIDGFGKYWTDGMAGYKPGMEYEEFFEDDYESGGCMLVKNHVLNAVWSRYNRWFDPEYNPLYSEDVDVCCEVRQLGYKVLHLNESGFFHAVSASTKKDDFANKWWPISLKNHDYFVRKWKDAIDKGEL
jgi:GT2 family glycosyltransferase